MCPSECLSCYNLEMCTSCKENFYLYGYSCISDPQVCLDNGYYPLGRVCRPCSLPCGNCSSSATICTSCIGGFVFHQGICLLECPRGTFLDSTHCSPCDSKCETCSGSSVYCLSCTAPYLLVLSSMSCTDTCPNSTFAVGGLCQVCQYPCLECVSQGECLSCLSGTLNEGNCLSSCPSGMFSGVNSTCEPCQSPCTQCESEATSCRQCESGYFLFGEQCLVNCPPTYFG